MTAPAVLPSGWSSLPLSELVEVGAPIIYGILQPGPDTPGGVPYVRPTEIVSGTIDVSAIRRTSAQIAQRYSRSRLRTGDVLLSIVGTIGKVALVPPDLEGGNITQSSVRIRPNERVVTRDWIAYSLRSPGARSFYEQQRLGTGVPRLNVAQVRELPIPVPSLAEQRRIVAKLDEALASIDAARNALDDVPALIEKYEQSVLAASFRALLGGATMMHPLESLVLPTRTITYGVVQTGDPVPDGVPTVRCGDIKAFTVAVDALKRIAPATEAQYPRTRLRGGEVLLAIRGSVGEVAVAPATLAGANVSREVAVIPVREDVVPDYLMYLLASPEVASAIRGRVKGVAQSGINIGDLRQIEVPLPSREHQFAVVDRVRDALARIHRKDTHVGRCREDLEVLEAAVLAKAFRGDLVAQDANDEPADALLARIRAEHPAGERTPRRRRTATA